MSKTECPMLRRYRVRKQKDIDGVAVINYKTHAFVYPEGKDVPHIRVCNNGGGVYVSTSPIVVMNG